MADKDQESAQLAWSSEEYGATRTECVGFRVYDTDAQSSLPYALTDLNSHDAQKRHRTWSRA